MGRRMGELHSNGNGEEAGRGCIVMRPIMRVRRGELHSNGNGEGCIVIRPIMRVKRGELHSKGNEGLLIAMI